MAVTAAEDRRARAKAERRLKTARYPLEKLQYLIIAKEGANAINRMIKSMQPFDEDGDKTIDFVEFLRGARAVGLDLNRDEGREMFEVLDRDLSGRISQFELTAALRPDMRRYRRDLVYDAFRRLDRNRRGYINSRDLLYHFDARSHPDYKSGRYSRHELEDRLLRDLGAGNGRMEISREDFVNYFSGVSLAFDRDDDFEQMIRGTFNI